MVSHSDIKLVQDSFVHPQFDNFHFTTRIKPLMFLGKISIFPCFLLIFLGFSHDFPIFPTVFPWNFPIKVMLQEASKKAVGLIGPATVGGMMPGRFRIGNAGGAVETLGRPVVGGRWSNFLWPFEK